jgi:hypothetical protein
MMRQDEASGSIFLAQFTVEKQSRDDCVAQAAQSLREMATRLERGEPEGTLFDHKGTEVGSFGLSDEHS